MRGVLDTQWLDVLLPTIDQLIGFPQNPTCTTPEFDAIMSFSARLGAQIGNNASHMIIICVERISIDDVSIAHEVKAVVAHTSLLQRRIRKKE